MLGGLIAGMAVSAVIYPGEPGITRDSLPLLAASSIAAMLPDIDHAQSFISRRAWLLSWVIRLFTRHRGFTHSMFAVLVSWSLMTVLKVPPSFVLAAVAGYGSHLLLDALTPSGLLLLWPLRLRVRLPLVRTGSVGELIVFCNLALMAIVLAF